MTEEEIYEHFIVDEDLQLLEEIEQEKRDKDQAARDYEIALQSRMKNKAASDKAQVHLHRCLHRLHPPPSPYRHSLKGRPLRDRASCSSRFALPVGWFAVSRALAPSPSFY